LIDLQLTNFEATMQVKTNSQSGMTVKTLLPFLALTFGLTWGIAALFILFTDPLVAVFGEMGITNPLFILAVYSPGVAALFLVWRHYGLKGLGRFLQRLALWRAPGYWWVFLILGIPAIVYAGAALKGTLGGPFPFAPWYQVFPALAIALFLGPIEEFGWRGLALPLLQRMFAPIGAGLIVGLIWAVWHIPAFLIGGTPQSAWSFAPYFAGVIAGSVILTALFNDSRGSLLMAVLIHFQLNNPVWPDAQPWDNLLLVAAAFVVVWLKRRAMFTRGSGVTGILMPEKGDVV
jgi:membrane protease YdiL (CAAX protease family)